MHGGGFTPLRAFPETSRPELVRLELDDVPLPGEGVREILSDKPQQLSVTAPVGDPFDFCWRRLWVALQEAWIALSILRVSEFQGQRVQWMLGVLFFTQPRNTGSPESPV